METTPRPGEKQVTASDDGMCCLGCSVRPLRQQTARWTDVNKSVGGGNAYQYSRRVSKSIVAHYLPADSVTEDLRIQGQYAGRFRYPNGVELDQLKLKNPPQPLQSTSQMMEDGGCEAFRILNDAGYTFEEIAKAIRSKPGAFFKKAG